ncbi:MAG: hypothetical protein ACJ72N_17900 [Labedaea sp.]
MTVSEQDVRELLESTDGDAVLVMVQGRVLVLSGQELDSGTHPGALHITSRAALVDQLGRTDLTEYERTELAAKLAAGVSNLGG